MNRFGLFAWAFIALVSTPATAAEDTEEAEERASDSDEGESAAPARDGQTTKTLAERIPSVTRRAFEKGGRVEVFPGVGTSINDPFFNHVALSGGLTYHVVESLSIGISGDFYASAKNQVAVTDGLALQQQFNRPLYAARLEVAWSPLYGKLSLLAEKVLHFDTYVLVGGGVVAPKQGDPVAAATVGIGQHFFFSEWFGLRFELRDQIFQMARGLGANANDKNLQNLLTASVGACFYLPPEFEREAL